MKKTIFEEIGGTYIRQGDYFIPCLTLLEEEEQRFIGVWGQRHLRYLKEYRRSVYLNLLTSGKLNDYLADIEEQAQERFERIVEHRLKKRRLCSRAHMASASSAICAARGSISMPARFLVRMSSGISRSR